MRRLMLIPLFFTIVGCATVPVRAPKPIPRAKGQPLQVNILGYSYTVPQRLDVTDHHQQAGFFAIQLQDRINRCKVDMAFISTTNREKFDRQYNEVTDAEVAGRERSGVTVSERKKNWPLWSGKARVRTLYLSRSQNEAVSAHLGIYEAKRQLGVRGKVFCDEHGFADSATALQIEFLKSGQQEAAPAKSATPGGQQPASQQPTGQQQPTAEPTASL